MNFLKRSKPLLNSSNDKLEVHKTTWKIVGSAAEFSFNEPKVCLLTFDGGKKVQKRPVYVWRSANGFRVLDMESGGEYEWMVEKGRLMVRRRLEKQAVKERMQYRLLHS